MTKGDEVAEEEDEQQFTNWVSVEHRSEIEIIRNVW